MNALLRKNKGITLIELLVALVISAILVGAIYRTFIGQQKTYTVQEQVVDLQQNVRAATNRMMAEIRMAGFGHIETLLPPPYGSAVTGVTIGGTTYNDIVNPNIPSAGAVTILYGVSFYFINGGNKEVVSTTAAADATSDQITVNSLFDTQGNKVFEKSPDSRCYVSIGGVESYKIKEIAGTTLTLVKSDNTPANFTYGHQAGTPVYGIRAVTYRVDGALTLLRDENMGAGGQPVADNIENLQLGYFGADGITAPANNAGIRIVQVALRGRTDFSDSDYKADGGYRKRQIASSIHLKNMGLEI